MAHSPTPWEAIEDPFEDQGYKVIISLPDKNGGYGTDIARCDHNWNESTAGEHRISWKEAETNATLIVTAVNERTDLLAANAAMRELVIQYRDDLRHPPAADSVERRLAAIEAALAHKGNGNG